ncbi:MAG: mechanosensitive ion channel [Bacteroidales bacterium]|nr:mechanosensitive ion channel [Bacteroidales bacterium]
MEGIKNDVMQWMQQWDLSESTTSLLIRIGAVLGMLLIAFAVDKLCKKTIIPVIRKLTEKTEFKWDNYLLSEEVLRDFCALIAPIGIYALMPLAVSGETLLVFLRTICQVYIMIVIMKLVCTFISTLYKMSCERDEMKNRSMKGFYQMLKLVVICVGSIVIISTLIGKSPATILAGLGAGTAILMLVFQDTIKGFVAGVQLIANDMLHPGDWITVPKYGADGNVLEVSLTTVKVRNWDNTIVTVPPYALVNDSFQNWKSMYDLGGRRVKRSIEIDMYTVRFFTEEEMEKLKTQPWMEGFEDKGNKVVNLSVFCHYVRYYLAHHPGVNKDMTLLVRQLQPSAHGMPIELYFFSASTDWIKYENLQSEVFEHLLASLSIFDLKVFQSPTGVDLRKIL